MHDDHTDTRKKIKLSKCSFTDCIVDTSVKFNKKAHNVATELVKLEFYPEFNQQRILKIDFNKTPHK